MRNSHNSFARSALAAALMAMFGQAMAADDDEEIDQFTKPSSSVSVGAGAWSDDRPQLGIFDGMRDNGGYLLFDADINKRDDATGTWNTLKVIDLGLDSREISAEHDVQGNWGLSLDYNKLPRLAPYTVNTGLQGIGTDTQTVNTIAPGTGNNVQLGTEREKYGLGFHKALMPGLEFKVNYTHEDKEGTRHWGRGGAPEFAAEPTDWTTRQLDAMVNYTTKNLQLTGGYYGSWFDNANDLVCTRTATNGNCWTSTTPYYLSVPLNNQAHQGYVNGGYNFTPTTRGTFKVSYTHATQDEHLPTADIGTLADPLSPKNLQGELNTTLVQLGLTARPMPNLSLLANLRYHNVDDDTPRQLIINTGTAPTLVHNTPLSYETISGKAEGTYNLGSGYSAIAGVDYSSQDRTVPFGSDTLPAPSGDGVDDQRYVPWRADIDETTYRLQLRKSLSETLNGSLAYLYSQRDGSTYAEAVHSEPGEGIRPTAIDPINIADRDRNKVRASMDWMPAERLSVQFNGEYGKDKYSGHTYGLREGTAWLFSTDASYAVNEDWELTAWYSHDNTEATQHGWREGSNASTAGGRAPFDLAELDKMADFNDTGDSIGLGLKGRLIPKLKIGADLQWTRNTSEINQALSALSISPTTGLPVATTGTLIYADGTAAAQLPDITSTVTRIKLFAVYALQKNSDLRVDLIHERWKTNDWSWQFSDDTPFTYGTTTDGTTVYMDPQQNSTFVGVRYAYKFQ